MSPETTPDKTLLITLILLAATCLALAILSGLAGAGLRKTLKDIRETPRLFFFDLKNAFFALRKTPWLFLVPCAVLFVTYMLEFISASDL